MNSMMQWDSVLGMPPAASIAPSGRSNLSRVALS